VLVLLHDGNVSIPVFEDPLSLALGIVDPAPDANVTGQQLTTALGSVSIDIAAVALLTGEQLTTALNSVSVDFKYTYKFNRTDIKYIYKFSSY
jgi:hypothetical protein